MKVDTLTKNSFGTALNFSVWFIYRDAKQNLCIDSKGNHFCCMSTTEVGNTAMEREFYGLFGDIFKNCKKIYYEAEFAFFWQVAELTKKPIARYW